LSSVTRDNEGASPDYPTPQIRGNRRNVKGHSDVEGSVPLYPPLQESHLEALCIALCDSEGGLTGSEIGKLLDRCRIPDPLPGGTKRWRLFEALNQRQKSDLCANNVLAFVKEALEPALFVKDPNRHALLLEAVNPSLAFAGYQVNSSGDVIPTTPVKTLTEAENRANRLGSELRRRGVRSEVLRFCRAELLADDYFHVVLEATKSITSLLRERTGLNLDGHELVDACFGTQDGKRQPRLAINSLTTPTEKSEHWGLAALIKGTFSFYRNPTAHEPRLKRQVDEQEAMDMLTLVSFLYREIEKATLIPSA
jgi:uncharacterized protein (TIGR02391 family)